MSSENGHAATAGPYQGLRPFTADRQRFFRGREKDTRVIAANTIAAPLTILYGPSGAGKTSVLLAGVIPFLERERGARVIVCREWQRGDALDAVRAQLSSKIPGPAISPAIPFDDLVSQYQTLYPQRLVFVFDQFEEFLRFADPGEQRTGVDAQIARTINRRDVEASFLISLREDSLFLLDRFQGRIPGLMSNRLQLNHLERPDAERAVREPLVEVRLPGPAGAQFRIEDEAVRLVLDGSRVDLAGSAAVGGGTDPASALPGATPEHVDRIDATILQLFLSEFWKVERAGGQTTLRAEVFRTNLGGHRTILEQYVERAVSALTPAEKRAAAISAKYLSADSGAKRSEDAASLARFTGHPVSSIRAAMDRLCDDPRSAGDAADRAGAPMLRHTSGTLDPVRYELLHDRLARPFREWGERWEGARAAMRRWLKIAAAAAASVVVLVVIVWVSSLQREMTVAKAALEKAAANEYFLGIWRAVGSIERAVSQREQPREAARVLEETDPTRRRWEWGYLHAQVDSWGMVLRGHDGYVFTASFSPDGTRVVTASDDKTARVWDPASGKELALLRGHEGRVNTASFSPDGARVVTASSDKTVRVWDPARGKELAVLRGHDGYVFTASFSPDGTRVVTASDDKTARVWDPASGKELALLRGHEGRVNTASFSPDGARVVTASNDNTARVWDPASGKELAVLRGHEGNVLTASFSPDGTRVVTASRDEIARVWDPSSGKELAVLRGHEYPVNTAFFSPDGTRVVTASSDKTVRVWDPASGKELAVLRGHDDDVNAASFSPDGTRVLTASDDMTARVWDPASGKELAVLRGHEDWVRSASFSPDGTRVVTASDDGTARVWKTIIGSPIAMLFQNAPDDPRYVDLHIDQFIVVINGRVNVRRSIDGVTLTSFDAGAVQGSFSPDGKRVVTTSSDNTTLVFDASSGEKLAVLRGHKDDLRLASLSRDWTRVVTASDDNTARIWDAASGKELAVLRGHNDSVNTASFSLDGTRVVTASTDKSARVWDAASGEELAVLRGHASTVRTALFSPDGTRVVTASWDDSARVWDAASGKELTVLRGHEDDVNAASFSLDGTRVVTASDDRTARVWDLASAKELAVLRGHVGSVYNASFSPDGARVTSSSSDNTIRIWDAASGAQIRVTPFGPDIRAMSLNSSHHLLAYVPNDGTARLVSTRSGAETRLLKGHADQVISARLSPDADRVVTASIDNSARVWNSSTGEQLAILPHDADVLDAVFSPDAALIATAAADSAARIWTLDSAQVIATLHGHEGLINAVSFSPDGATLVTASSDRTARLWDTRTTRHLHTLTGHDAEVLSAAFSPDGRFVVTGSADKTARVWDAATGKQLALLQGHDAPTVGAFSPDGARIVTASADGTARVWDAISGIELITLRGHEKPVRSAAFSDDGTQIYTAGDDGSIRVWDSIPRTERLKRLGLLK